MRSLFAGLRALSHGKLILLLTLTSVVLGIGAAAPLGPVFAERLAGTLAGDHFIRNAPTAAPTDLFDFMFQERGAVGAQRGASRFFGLASVILQAFFAGGMIAVLGRGPFSFGQFFEPARRNFWHNVKCLFLFALSLAVVGGIVVAGLVAASKKLLADAPPDAAARTAWIAIEAIAAVLIWGALSLWYDFARAARRYAPAIGAWRAYGFARRALRGSRIRALILFLVWFVAGAAVWAAPVALAWKMTAVSIPAIAALFFVQFVGLWVRSAVRVAAWGSYVEFLDHRADAALGARPEERAADSYAVRAPA